MLIPFEPDQPALPSNSELERLYARGRFKEAEKARKQLGLPLSSLEVAVRRGLNLAAFSLRRPGEAFSFAFERDMYDWVNLEDVLRTQFKLKDWHGFLKNVHRIKWHQAFLPECSEAFRGLEAKSQFADVESWRRKYRAAGVNL